jgi:hypothetical protein
MGSTKMAAVSMGWLWVFKMYSMPSRGALQHPDMGDPASLAACLICTALEHIIMHLKNLQQAVM